MPLPKPASVLARARAAHYAGRMTRPVGSRTIDGAQSLRCMIVGLSPEAEAACRRAIVPVEVVKKPDVREACASMSTVLPLIVVVDEGISDTDRSSLADMALACGAEVVLAAPTPAREQLSALLLDALRVAERRRLGGLR